MRRGNSIQGKQWFRSLRRRVLAVAAAVRRMLRAPVPVRGKKPAATDSLLDALTGVANRRALEAQLRWVWARAAGQRQPTSLLLLQVDHFEQYEGHHRAPGDACLQRVAAALAEAAGPGTGLLARLSAWEFALLLPEADEPAAIAMGERLRRAVAAADLPHTGSCWGLVTVSVGCGTAVPDAATTPGTLLAAADAALQRAKADGHNRVAYSLPNTFRWGPAFQQECGQSFAAAVPDGVGGVPGWSPATTALHPAVA